MLEIIQGSNNPIILEFNEDMEAINGLEVSLNSASNELKHWSLSNVGVNGNTIILNLSESDTLNFSSGPAILDVKILDSEDNVIFYDSVNAKVVYKYDKTQLKEA